jgi:lipid II:glycine glycyltransferase (peptidoglycan interpeptide bridge formation enzyme)
VDDINQAQWNEFLGEFGDASIYQTSAYGAVRWGEKRLSRLVLENGNSLAGIAQVAVVSLPLMRAGIAYLPWGPLWERKGSSPDLERFRSIIRALKEEYVVKRGLLLRIAPAVPREERPEIFEMLIEEGFTQSAPGYRTIMLDLSPDLQTLRKQLDQKWRNQLNRAEKNGLTLREGSGDDLYDVFVELYRRMLYRKQFRTDVDVEVFRAVQKGLPEPQKMRILLCESEGRPIAAMVVTWIGDRGIYLLGASSDDGNQKKGSYLLQWRMIEWMKEQGCRRYDLGGIDPVNNPSVYHFKRGIAKTVCCHIGQFEISPNRFVKRIVNSGEALRKLLYKDEK